MEPDDDDLDGLELPDLEIDGSFGAVPLLDEDWDDEGGWD